MTITPFTRSRSSRRRGATVVVVAVGMAMMLSFAALTLDVGLMFNTKAELQRSADSAALAGTIALMNQNRLQGEDSRDEVIAAARTQTHHFAGRNEVYNTDPAVNDGDIQIGYLANPFDPNETMDFSNPARFNAVRVVVRRDDLANGPIDLLFARIFGRSTATVAAEATAAMLDGVDGYRVTEQTGNADLLPLALKVTSWNDLLSETVTTGDSYTYDPTTGEVTGGPDGILELNLYPGSGAGQLPPGNYGTVDIGPPNNSTSDLSRQIREGVSAEDLDYFGGELRFGDDGTFELNGDTGLSAGIKDDLEAIIGMPRTIPLFSTVSGNGNNANYTIVGFAGVRIMFVKLTGSMSSKKVIIQPAFVSDDAVISGVNNGSSYFVFKPVQLVR